MSNLITDVQAKIKEGEELAAKDKERKKSREEQAEMLKRLMLASEDFMELILGIMELPPNVQLAIDDLVKACNESKDSL